MASYVFDYFTEADLRSLWDDFEYETLPAIESELPCYEK